MKCLCGDMCRAIHAAAGNHHSVVLTACGAVMTSGCNAHGQLGHGRRFDKYVFTRVESLRSKRVSTVAAGHDNSAAVGSTSGRRLYTWGRGETGQLGTGDGRSHWRPTLVQGFSVAPPRDVVRPVQHIKHKKQNCTHYKNFSLSKKKSLFIPYTS